MQRYVGVADGPVAAIGSIPLAHLGLSGLRTFVFDPARDGWGVVDDDCAEPDGDLFAADGQVWRSWTEVDGLLLHWAPLLPQ